MSKLKENIDRILGSSLRCLLPSYWWKRIFGFLVEEIEDVRSTANSKATKSEVASLSNSVDALSDKVDNIDSGNKIVIDSALSLGSTNPVQNKVVTNELNAIYPVFRIRNTKDSGFAAYLAAAHKVFQNTDKTNKFPIAIVGKDSGDAICDALVNTYANEAGLEFNVRNKRYRWVFNLEAGSTDYGAFIREEQVSSAGGLETRSFKSTNSTTDKEWNKETISLFLEGKVNIVYPYPAPNLPDGASIDLMPHIHIYENGTHQFWFTEQHTSGGYTNHIIAIQSDGTYDDDIEDFKPDTEMSDTSTSPVQNKVIKKYVDTEVAKKVDKVSGKGLSTEDFTTLLKTKLEGLENYDDTTLTNAISSLETRLNTLVSGDTSAAIESFNEVVAFLENLTDTQDLSSIIASIEQQINATKVELQNVVDEVIENEEVTSKGLNSLNQKIAQAINDRKINYATKAELNSEVEVINKEAIDNEEVTSMALNYLNQRIDKLKNDLLINYAKGATLRAEIEAIMAIISDNEKVISTSLNDLNERIEFTNNKFVNYALKEELSSEVSRIEQIILTNEKVISASLNDLNERVEQVSNLIKSSLTTN